MAAPIKDVVSMMDTEKHGPETAESALPLPSAEASAFADQMMQELLGKKPDTENTDDSNS